MFFLNPGEYLETKIEDVVLLGENDSLLLKARDSFEEGKESRKAGETWMIHGPRDFLPGLQVEIIEKREAIPLKENDGVYIKNKKTGEVTLVTGEQRYVLTQDEVLWRKELPLEVE